jgi:hypothetical protein
MHRDYIIGKISYEPTDTASNIVLKEIHVKKGGGCHILFYVNTSIRHAGYKVSNQVRGPLLDQFAEDLDDV